MKISNLLKERLLTDRVFRLHTAGALEVSERNIEKLAEKRSMSLTKLPALLVYKKFGFKQSEIMVESDSD